MRRELRGLALAVTMAATSHVGVARAGFVDGNELWDVCRKDTPASRAACASYVSGSVDALDFAITGTPVFCLRPGVKSLQATDIVRRHLESHPQDRDRGAEWLVLTALADAFPCKAGK